jgi:hypothetical protein
MLMERNAEIIRGWPYDGSLERVEVIKTGSTLQNGDWVIKQTDNSVDKSTATTTNAAGLVIVGTVIVVRRHIQARLLFFGVIS